MPLECQKKVGNRQLGEAVSLEVPLARTWLSPRNDFALGETANVETLLLIQLEGTARIQSLPDIAAGADLVAISPSGSTAALYSQASGTVQWLTGLPQTPVSSGKVEVSNLSSDLPRMAVSDDGIVLLGVSANGTGAVHVVSRSGSTQQIWVGREVAALSFLGRSQDALIADRQANSAWLIYDVTGAAVVRHLAGEGQGLSGPMAIEASEDGRRAFIVNSGSQTISVIDVESSQTQQVAAGRNVAGLHRLRGDSVFRLTDPSEAPLLLLDASTPDARVLFVPFDSSLTDSRGLLTLRQRGQSRTLRLRTRQ